jgi:hypothetical protein
VLAINNTKIKTIHIFLVYLLEGPDISKANSLTITSQQEGQFALPRFSSVFTTFTPKHLFTFTRTQFTVVAEFTVCKKSESSELILC